MIQQAVILCGGKGTRLFPLTETVPKSLLPLSGTTLIEDQLGWLGSRGVRRVVLCTGHLAETIESRVGDGRRFGVTADYSREDQPLGTAGAVKKIVDRLDDNFFVVYGDVFFRLDLLRLAQFHIGKKAAATLVVHFSSHANDSDLVEMDRALRITSIARRAPRADEKPLGNAAFLALNRVILDLVPPGKNLDFARDVFPTAVKKAPCYGYDTAEYIFDVGTRERYERLIADLKEGRVR